MNLLETVQHLQNSARAEADTAVRLLKPEYDGAPVAIVPNGYTVQVLNLDKYLDRPRRTDGTFAAATIEAFLEYFDRFQDDHSVILADPTQNSLLAILDYHAPLIPAFCGHKITFKLQKTQEWAKFLDRDGKEFTQLEFAEFVEDMQSYFFSPPAGEMLDVSRHLSARKSAEFQSGIRLSNGAVQLEWVETVKGTVGTGKTEVPEEFTIGLIPFRGAAPIQQRARLRYRINNGTLTFQYRLNEPHRVAEATFRDAVSRVAAETKRPVLEGAVSV